jgi:hypothetical protein
VTEVKNMDTPIINEHDIVVAAIRDANSARFTPLTNVGGEQHFIAQMFPDIILMDKATNRPAFIIEVKKNGSIAQCIQQWKSVISIPATLYIVVPQSDLPTAKSILQVVGLQARVGSYSIDANNHVTVNYE